LGGLPLALRSVGQHLGSPLVQLRSFDDYLLTLTPDYEPARRLGKPEDEEEGLRLLATTWELSLDALANSGTPQARKLIWILAYFSPAQPIWLHSFDTTSLVVALGGRATLEMALRALRSVGLIDVQLRSDRDISQWILLIHPVVSDIMRARVIHINRWSWRRPLQKRIVSEIHTVAIKMITNVVSGLDPHNTADWVIWQELIPHLRSQLEYLGDCAAQEPLRLLVDAANSTLRAHIAGGWFESAEDLATITVAKARRLGLADAATMLAQDNRARVYREKGDLGKAESGCREVLVLMTQHLGPLHADTLAARNHLGRILREKGDLVAAEVEYRTALAGKLSTLGPNHISTLMSWNNVGFVLREQGRYEEALHETEGLLSKKRAVLGGEHPSTLMTWNNLCAILLSLKRLDEAHVNIEELLAVRQRILGAEHPYTLNTLFDRAKVRFALGLYSSAASDADAVVEGRVRQLGSNHPETMNAREFCQELHTRLSFRAVIAITRSSVIPGFSCASSWWSRILNFRSARSQAEVVQSCLNGCLFVMGVNMH
jgi:tetratricopeptide (TPR) repeat protein